MATVRLQAVFDTAAVSKAVRAAVGSSANRCSFFVKGEAESVWAKVPCRGSDGVVVHHDVSPTKIKAALAEWVAEMPGGFTPTHVIVKKRWSQPRDKGWPYSYDRRRKSGLVITATVRFELVSSA